MNTRPAVQADVAVHLLLARSFDPVACRVTVATNRSARDRARLEEELEGSAATVVGLTLGDFLGPVTGVKGLWARAAATGLLALAVVRLAAVVVARGIDVLHTTERPRDALLALSVATLTRRPLVIHMHNKATPHIGRVTLLALRSATAVIAISQFVQRSLIEVGIPADRIHLVYNAIDGQRLAARRQAGGGLRRRLPAGAEARPLVAVIGRLIRWKGQLELLEAMPAVLRRLPGAHLVIVGREEVAADPGYRGKLEAAVRRLGLEARVSWVDHVADIAGAHADIDVFCVPSWEEPFGLVAAEAMALGQPVVAFATGAMPELIRNGADGLLVPPHDPEALAGAIVRLATQPELAARLGRSAREQSRRRFSPALAASAVVDVYRRILDRDGLLAQPVREAAS